MGGILETASGRRNLANSWVRKSGTCEEEDGCETDGVAEIQSGPAALCELTELTAAFTSEVVVGKTEDGTWERVEVSGVPM